MRAVERVTGTSYDAIASLLVGVGQACKEFHDLTVRNIQAKYVECDEVHGFCYAKQKNVPDKYQDIFGYGTNWTWIAIDSKTKLTITWLVGLRTSDYVRAFISDLESRLAGPVQLVTDGYSGYVDAIGSVFEGLCHACQEIRQQRALYWSNKRAYLW
jgi:hypothetical protein